MKPPETVSERFDDLAFHRKSRDVRHVRGRYAEARERVLGSDLAFEPLANYRRYDSVSSVARRGNMTLAYHDPAWWLVGRPAAHAAEAQKSRDWMREGWRYR